jgi:hypothetical protein
MEDHAGLLGKTMNNALFWLLHLIKTLLAFDGSQGATNVSTVSTV